MFFFDKNIELYNYINSNESFHINKVLKFNKHDKIKVTDGKGNLFICSIVDKSTKNIKVEIIQKIENYQNINYKLHIAIAPTKNINRFEWFVEKCTEIGIDEITPLLCKNSERKIVRTDRLNRIAESAMKQSYKVYHPKINEITPYNEVVSQAFLKKQKFIAHCVNDEKEYFANLITKHSDVIILIGPEGDFTHDEILLAKEKFFTPTSLGNSRLRTETAGVVACNIVSVIDQFS